jgi:hypothetical protein
MGMTQGEIYHSCKNDICEECGYPKKIKNANTLVVAVFKIPDCHTDFMGKLMIDGMENNI